MAVERPGPYQSFSVAIHCSTPTLAAASVTDHWRRATRRRCRWPRPSADRWLPWASHLRPAGVGYRSQRRVFLRAKYQDSDRDDRLNAYTMDITVYMSRSEIRRIIVPAATAASSRYDWRSTKCSQYYDFFHLNQCSLAKSVRTNNVNLYSP